jgi:hypothetical protein
MSSELSASVDSRILAGMGGKLWKVAIKTNILDINHLNATAG